ncbi:hypothetical protein ERS043966_02050, partial [Streptococcus pneumoniae]
MTWKLLYLYLAIAVLTYLLKLTRLRLLMPIQTLKPTHSLMLRLMRWYLL